MIKLFIEIELAKYLAYLWRNNYLITSSTCLNWRRHLDLKFRIATDEINRRWEELVKNDCKLDSISQLITFEKSSGELNINVYVLEQYSEFAFEISHLLNKVKNQ